MCKYLLAKAHKSLYHRHKCHCFMDFTDKKSKKTNLSWLAELLSPVGHASREELTVHVFIIAKKIYNVN